MERLTEAEITFQVVLLKENEAILCLLTNNLNFTLHKSTVSQKMLYINKYHCFYFKKPKIVIERNFGANAKLDAA